MVKEFTFSLCALPTQFHPQKSNHTLLLEGQSIFNITRLSVEIRLPTFNREITKSLFRFVECLILCYEDKVLLLTLKGTSFGKLTSQCTGNACSLAFYLLEVDFDFCEAPLLRDHKLLYLLAECTFADPAFHC